MPTNWATQREVRQSDPLPVTKPRQVRIRALGRRRTHGPNAAPLEKPIVEAAFQARADDGTVRPIRPGEECTVDFDIAVSLVGLKRAELVRE